MSKSIVILTRRSLVSLIVLAGVLLIAPRALAQANLSEKGKETYNQIKAFSLTGGSAVVEALNLKKDRAEMTFDGTFYFASPVEGRVTGAVFIGLGRFRAQAPPNEFEKDNLRRMLGTDVVESDFKIAVLRFTDDTFDLLAKDRREGGTPNDKAQKLASEADTRILKETGANLSARLALSILNSEAPGVFFAVFDEGKRGRFSLLLDYQNRIPVANFGLNGGEKGLIFHYDSALYGNDEWMAFYSQQDYARRVVEYSDTNDLVDITHYQMNVDLRDGNKLRLSARVDMRARYPSLRAVSFQIGESLGEYENRRLKKQMRLKSARCAGADLAAVQEDWEGGLTVYLPFVAQAGKDLTLELEFEGDFMYDAQTVLGCSYPISNEVWFPRHGYLDRATYDLTFVHARRKKIASVGIRLSEEPAPGDKDNVITKYRMPHPVALVTFALGPFERHSETVKWEKGGEPTPLEFNSMPGNQLAVKEDFIMAEMNNSLRYFNALFGKYPYPTFGAAFHPFGFGQGFPSLLMIPAADYASKNTYKFIAHETAHQWWGNIVAWRSYRDQWLSEGFAEYSGILYTGLRENSKARDELLDRLRRSLREPPRTLTGIGEGRLADVGPIILGHRLNTKKTLGAYQALIYNKGALVLRMLHFLMTDTADGNGDAFFAMMTDFVERYRNGFASTDDFRVVANEHFAKTPIARKYRLKDLNWFFNQWVYRSELPSYHLDYQIQSQPDGSVILKGTLSQTNASDNWFMVLPLQLTLGDGQFAHGTIHAFGPKTPVEIKLPSKPRKVELDPSEWVLSEKTTVKGG